MDHEDSISSANGPYVPRKKRQRIFQLCDHYTIEERENDDGATEVKAVCDYCGQEYTYNSENSETHLIEHWRETHCDNDDEDEDEDEDEEEEEEEEAPNSGSHHGSNFESFEEKVTKSLAKLIISEELPLRLGEDEEFVHFVRTYLNPAYPTISTETVGNEIVAIYKESRKEVISEFSDLKGSISCSATVWSDENFEYVCVAAHYIDANWVLHKKMIAFDILEYPNSITYVFEHIMTVLKEFGIAEKVLCFTVDNHIAVSDTIEKLKNHVPPACGEQLFHGKCFSHMINSVVQEGFKKLHAHLENIRLAICNINCGQEEFDALCEDRGLGSKIIRSDFSNRWNSTYLMLESCINYDALITEYINDKYGSDLELSENDWKMTLPFSGFLKVFYDAVNNCSGVYYPTSCVILMELCTISEKFSECRDDVILSNIIHRMEKKLKKYLDYISPHYCLAAVMDPRIKLEGVKILLDQISKNLNMSLNITIDEVNAQLISMYNMYESKYADVKGKASSSVSVGSSSKWSMLIKARLEKPHNTEDSSELIQYLTTDFANLFIEGEFQDVDILSWWKARQERFPVLSIMARDLLTPPASTEVPKFAFLAGSRILDSRRSRFPPRLLNVVKCLKDWHDGKSRIQDEKDDMIEYHEKGEVL